MRWAARRFSTDSFMVSCPAATGRSKSANCARDSCDNSPISTPANFTDSAAWDEWVVDSPAWDEWVVDSPAWNETVYLGIQFSDGTFFAAGDEASADAYEESVVLAGGSISSSNVYGSVHHDEVGHTVHHDETGHAVHHDAVTHTEDVYGTCPACGGSGTV